jgi:hypothetical protein
VTRAVAIVRSVALFKRKAGSPSASSGDVGALLLEGHDMIAQTASAHRRRWGLGGADQWGLDQTAGLLRWSFSDKNVEAPAQILATYSLSSGSWMWAWANETLSMSLRQASEDVKRWGEANAAPMLTRSSMEISEEQAADLAAIAFRVSRATGFYRATTGTSIVYLTFGPVTITGFDGREPETFSIDIN